VLFFPLPGQFHSFFPILKSAWILPLFRGTKLFSGHAPKYLGEYAPQADLQLSSRGALTVLPELKSKLRIDA
jgi:hypothetical protein